MIINKEMIVWCGDSLIDDDAYNNAPTVARSWDYGVHHYSWIVSDTIDARYVNTGICGDKIANIDANKQSRIFDYNPTLLVIEGGGNDCGSGFSATDTAEHMRNIIQTALDRDIQVILLWLPLNVSSWSPPNVSDFLTLRPKYVALAESFKTTYPDDFLFIDLDGTRLGTTSSSASTIPNQYRIDGLHFNTGGLMAIAEEFLSQLFDADNTIPARMKQTAFIPKNNTFDTWDGSILPTGDYVYTWTPNIVWTGIAGGVENTIDMSADTTDYIISDSGVIIDGFATLGGE